MEEGDALDVYTIYSYTNKPQPAARDHYFIHTCSLSTFDRQKLCQRTVLGALLLLAIFRTDGRDSMKFFYQMT